MVDDLVGVGQVTPQEAGDERDATANSERRA